MLTGISIFGQNPTEKSAVCTNETVQKISSRGIKIGANLDDVINLFASTEEEKNRIRNSVSGPIKTNIGYEIFAASPKPNDKKFEGIDSYIFYFLDNQLVGFGVQYPKPIWTDVNQFNEKLIEFFNLPNLEYWNRQNGVRNNIKCGDYVIGVFSAGSGNNSRLDIYNVQTEKILEQRESKLKEETREKDIKAFKP